jgi:hypothetical protein
MVEDVAVVDLGEPLVSARPEILPLAAPRQREPVG